jgi:deoxycytidine triphosphate deaminase
MILSDREIRAAVSRGAIGVSDMPPAWDTRWASHALDLTLDAEISVWEEEKDDKGVEPPLFAPGSKGFKAEPLIHEYTRPDRCDGDGYVLKPRSFVLGWTIEKIRLPYESRIGARVEGKSSLARIGLGIHVLRPRPFTLVSAPRKETPPIRAVLCGWRYGTSVSTEFASLKVWPSAKSCLRRFMAFPTPPTPVSSPLRDHPQRHPRHLRHQVSERRNGNGDKSAVQKVIPRRPPCRSRPAHSARTPPQFLVRCETGERRRCCGAGTCRTQRSLCDSQRRSMAGWQLAWWSFSALPTGA